MANITAVIVPKFATSLHILENIYVHILERNPFSVQSAIKDSVRNGAWKFTRWIVTISLRCEIIFLFLSQFWNCGFTSTHRRIRSVIKNSVRNETWKFTGWRVTISLRCEFIFLFLKQNMCCGYSKQPSQWDGCFEHPKQMFKLMDKLFAIYAYFCIWTYGLCQRKRDGPFPCSVYGRYKLNIKFWLFPCDGNSGKLCLTWIHGS